MLLVETDHYVIYYTRMGERYVGVGKVRSRDNVNQQIIYSLREKAEEKNERRGKEELQHSRR